MAPTCEAFSKSNDSLPPIFASTKQLILKGLKTQQMSYMMMMMLWWLVNDHLLLLYDRCGDKSSGLYARLSFP
jgi:hypothetical protein